ncbi:MAG TPA: endonuclease [Ignavibacteria bacterium]
MFTLSNYLKIRKRIVLIFFLLFFSLPSVYSQDDAYYSSLNSGSATFIADLKTRIRVPYTQISYDQFDETNVANFASFDNGNGTRSVYCVYSGYNYIYTPPFTWVTMSREHTWCYSWQPTNPSTSAEPYTDQYHLFPTEQNHANAVRNNHPLGIVSTLTSSFLESKYGRDAAGNIVFEPRDSHKGDAARAILYMCVRYDGISGNQWTFNWLNTKLTALSEGPQDLNTLLQWNKQDPPDKWEVSRNNYIQSIQQNRNPFVDHPEYIYYINFSDLSKLTPAFSAEPDNYVSNFIASANGTSITLSWIDAIAGNQSPSGYILEAFNKDDYFIPVDGTVVTDDNILSDGKAVININYSAANTYTFDNLTPSTTYYFRMYSYNGDGSIRNYKTTGTVPSANTGIPGTLATEPANYVTGFSTGTLTSSSIALGWTDALPGTQAPSGYLILANNNNSFTTPADGNSYADDLNLSDGSAIANVDYSAPDNFSFSSLSANITYYFRIYSYNGTGATRNYKTDGTVPAISATTSQAVSQNNFVLLDNFNRTNNNTLGNTFVGSNMLTWYETESASGTGVQINSNRLQLASSTSGRDLAYVNLSGLPGYPSILSTSTVNLQWAFNMRQSRTDPSGFDAGNYGDAFILGMSSANYATANGYAVVLGQSGTTNAIRLVYFTSGLDANAKTTNIISANNYGAEYLSIKVKYIPTTNTWSLYAESNAIDYPQSDPWNTSVQVGSDVINGTYTGTTLNYLGCLWNHNITGTENATFDEIYISDPGGVNPVEMKTFSGMIQSNNVNLKWITSKEINCSGYEIFRMDIKNGIWQIIGFIEGRNNNYETEYSFSDKNLQSGNYHYKLRQIDYNGNDALYYLNEIINIGVPSKLTLDQNFPNPFNPVTKINFSLPENSRVTLKIYDVKGKEIAVLINNEMKSANYYTVEFNGSNLASGVYFYSLQAGNLSVIKKMILLK